MAFFYPILRTLLYTIDEQNKLLPISFIMCDIDGLKAVNDTYGHGKGNEYITLCHEVMRSSLHAEDYIFRLGGDEFLAILTNTERQVVQERVKTIESKMKTIKKEYHTSISLGSATAEKTPIDSAQLIKEADEEMYQKKAQRKIACRRHTPVLQKSLGLQSGIIIPILSIFPLSTLVLC